MKELREERIKKEEEKLMTAIHEQYKKAHLDYELDRELKMYEKKEKKSKANLVQNIALVIAIITIIILGMKYNEKEINNCMESGSSETFCRYAGE